MKMKNYLNQGEEVEILSDCGGCCVVKPISGGEERIVKSSEIENHIPTQVIVEDVEVNAKRVTIYPPSNRFFPKVKIDGDKEEYELRMKNLRKDQIRS